MDECTGHHHHRKPIVTNIAQHIHFDCIILMDFDFIENLFILL